MQGEVIVLWFRPVARSPLKALVSLREVSFAVYFGIVLLPFNAANEDSLTQSEDSLTQIVHHLPEKCRPDPNPFKKVYYRLSVISCLLYYMVQYL